MSNIQYTPNLARAAACHGDLQAPNADIDTDLVPATRNNEQEQLHLVTISAMLRRKSEVSLAPLMVQQQDLGKTCCACSAFCSNFAETLHT